MKTVQIIICDSDTKYRAYFAERCHELAEKLKQIIKIKPFENASDLLFQMDNPAFREAIDILFLEVDGPNKDGIEIALELRKMGYANQIIFTARSHPGNRIEAVFEAQGSEYILKSSRTRFDSVFIRAMDTVREMKTEYVLYNRVGEYRQIAISDIHYFDVRDHLVCVHYRNEEFEFLSTLTKVETQLCERGFCRIHRLYVVSLDAVHRSSSKEVELTNGSKLPVGRTYANTFKNALESWQQIQKQEAEI